IPGGKLVDENKALVTGVVDAVVTYIDPTTTSPDAYPGPLVGLMSGEKDLVKLTSFGMVEVHLTQDGKLVDLAPGATARIDLAIPAALTDKVTSGETIPAWDLSPAEGYWSQVGSGTVIPSGPGLVWQYTSFPPLYNIPKNCDQVAPTQ